MGALLLFLYSVNVTKTKLHFVHPRQLVKVDVGAYKALAFPFAILFGIVPNSPSKQAILVMNRNSVAPMLPHAIIFHPDMSRDLSMPSTIIVGTTCPMSAIAKQTR